MLPKKTEKFSLLLKIFLTNSCLFLAAFPANAQWPGSIEQTPSSYYSNALRAVANGFKSVYCPAQPEPLKNVCSNVPIIVEETYGIGAFAIRSSGTSRITISTGMAEMFDALDWGRIASFELTGSGVCWQRWAGSYFRSIVSNIRRIGAGLAPVAVPYIEAYAPTDASCRGINSETVRQIKRKNADYHARNVESSLAFVMLHELGHVYNKHMTKSFSSLSVKRAQETEADDLVVAASSRAGQAISNGLFPIFLIATQGDSLQWEQQSTHPLGVRRGIRIYEQFIEMYSTSSTMIAKIPGHLRREHIADLQAAVQGLRRCEARIDDGQPC